VRKLPPHNPKNDPPLEARKNPRWYNESTGFYDLGDEWKKLEQEYPETAKKLREMLKKNV